MTGKMLKRKARPGLDGNGRIPLHYAAADGDADKCETLLASGADPNAQDDNGWSPLHFAAQASAAAATAVLLAAGASPHTRDANGDTPLFTAVFSSRGNGDVIMLLRDAGADPKAENSHGVSPLSLARTIANFDVAQYFKNIA